MNIFSFNASLPKMKLIASADSFFATVREDYPLYRQNGFFDKLNHSSVFVYKISSSSGVHIGLLACADVEDYLNGKILRHENTLAPKEQEMINLLIQRKAMVKPVMIAHAINEELAKIYGKIIQSKEPVLTLNFESEGELHELWDVYKDKDIEKIQNIFENDISSVYIADGHHRTTTNAYLYKNLKNQDEAKSFRKLLSGFFAFDQFIIYDYNRCVEALSDISATKFIAKLSKYFEIEPINVPALPSQKHQLTMFIQKEWYLLTWKEAVLKKYKNNCVLLDAELLDKIVFENILGISDRKSSGRIEYISGKKGIPGVLKYCRKDENNVGFFLVPVQMEEIVEYADKGKVMPPKSTWFEPRARNGIVVKDVKL